MNLSVNANSNGTFDLNWQQTGAFYYPISDYGLQVSINNAPYITINATSYFKSTLDFGMRFLTFKKSSSQV